MSSSVAGAGGLMALLLIRVLAAGFVGFDTVDAPRELAARLVAEAVAPAGAEEAVAAASGGLGADVVIEAAGPPAVLGAALELVRGRGTLSVVRAQFEPDHPLNNARMFELEITLQRPRALQGMGGCRPIAAVKEKLTHAFKSRTGEIGARWPRLVASRAPLAYSISTGDIR